jgi:hypothetical protein
MKIKDSISRPSGKVLMAVIVWLILIITLAMLAVKDKTVTVDEYHHLPAGCHILTTGEFFMHSKSPPLVRLWSALPILAMNVDVPRGEQWREFASGWGPWVYGIAFQMRNTKMYERIFFWGRLMNALWLIPLGLILFLWSNRLYGLTSAWIAVVLLGLSPTILAHAPLVTTDLAATATCFASMYFFWLSGLYPDRSWPARNAGIGAGMALGLGLLSKFTLLLVPLMWMAMAAAACFVPNASPGSTGQTRGVGQFLHGSFVTCFWGKTSRCVRVVLLPVVIAFTVVSAGYGFKGVGTSLRALPCHSTGFQKVEKTVLGRLPLPFPRDFVVGLDEQTADTKKGEFASYLCGKWSRNGWWYYYPTAFLIKNPPAFLLLLLVSVLTVRFSTQRDWWTIIALIAPVAILFMILCFASLDIGIRYTLPAYPFLILLAVRIVPLCTVQRARQVLLTLCLAWFAVSSLAAYPDFLAYFSETVGGTRYGHRYLLDSNIDWGQDLKGLKSFMDHNGITTIQLAYYGHVWPQQYGINFRMLGNHPEPGYVAASVAFVCGQPYAVTYGTDRVIPVPANAYAWLSHYKPIARVGASIWVYRFDDDSCKDYENQNSFKK